MAKTGGGPGTNQYGVRGVGKSRGTKDSSGRSPEVTLAGRALDSRYTGAIADLIQRYPTAPGDVQAVGEPSWADVGDALAGIEPKGPERAIARFHARGAEAIYNDAHLEGMGFTLPEIEDLLGGTHVPGHTEGELEQVADMKKAAAYLVNRVLEGPIEPSQKISDDLHMFIAGHLNIPTMEFRGDQRLRYDGPLVTLGRGEKFRALDARVLGPVLESGLDRIRAIPHPVVRGATWAAFSAYHQFYFDGNKRAGRYVMNAVAMSHGFDAILVPAARKPEYETIIVGALRSGDLTEHIAFLLGLYSDGSAALEGSA